MMNTAPSNSVDNAHLQGQAERVLCRLSDGRYIMAAFVSILPAEIERAQDRTPPPLIRPPSFMDVVEACEMIGQGACRPFTGLSQIAPEFS